MFSKVVFIILTAHVLVHGLPTESKSVLEAADGLVGSLLGAQNKEDLNAAFFHHTPEPHSGNNIDIYNKVYVDGHRGYEDRRERRHGRGRDHIEEFNGDADELDNDEFSTTD